MSNGARGPDGQFVEFPPCDPDEEPRENKKAFTLFCKANRRGVKNSLDECERQNRVGVVQLFIAL